MTSSTTSDIARTLPHRSRARIRSSPRLLGSSLDADEGQTDDACRDEDDDDGGRRAATTSESVFAHDLRVAGDGAQDGEDRQQEHGVQGLREEEVAISGAPGMSSSRAASAASSTWRPSAWRVAAQATTTNTPITRVRTAPVITSMRSKRRSETFKRLSTT